MAFTTKKGLVIDFDCFDLDNVCSFSEGLSRKEGLGDVLIMQSNWHGQMTLEGLKAYHAHAIFGAVLPHHKVQRILRRLQTLHIVEEAFRFFHEVEWELTLRTVPKRVGDSPPVPHSLILIDGRNRVIIDYIEQWQQDVRIFKEVIAK